MLAITLALPSAMMSEVQELKHLSGAVAVSIFYHVIGKHVSQLALCANRIDENYVLYHWPQFKEVCIENVKSYSESS